MLVLGLIHRSLKTRGFTLSRSPLSTDIIVMGLLVLIPNAWALLVTLPGRGSSSGFLTVPWIAVIFSWLYASNLASVFLYGSSTSENWKMDCSNGPFGWQASLNPYCISALSLGLLATQMRCSVTLILEGNLIQGTSSIVSLALFLLSAFPYDEYVSAPHRYRGDMLRIALPASHIEATVYVFPSRKYGFEAIWSPKVRSEHRQTDSEIMALFSFMRTGSYSLSEPLRKSRTTISTFNEEVILSDQEVNDLAEWVLTEPWIQSGNSLYSSEKAINRPVNQSRSNVCTGSYRISHFNAEGRSEAGFAQKARITTRNKKERWHG